MAAALIAVVVSYKESDNGEYTHSKKLKERNHNKKSSQLPPGKRHQKEKRGSVVSHPKAIKESGHTHLTKAQQAVTHQNKQGIRDKEHLLIIPDQTNKKKEKSRYNSSTNLNLRGHEVPGLVVDRSKECVGGGLIRGISILFCLTDGGSKAVGLRIHRLGEDGWPSWCDLPNLRGVGAENEGGAREEQNEREPEKNAG